MPYPANWYGKIDELPQGRKGTPLSPDGNRTYTRQFLVEVTGNGKLMGPIGVCDHPLLPRPWSFYISNTEYDTLALLQQYDAAPRDQDDWSFWIVTATYSTASNGNFQAPPSGGGPGDFPNNPSNAYNNPEYEYPEIEFNYEEQHKPVTHDLDGKPYQNSAKQPFTPPPTFPRAYRVLSITRNELNFNAAVADSYAYAVNDRDFLGSPAGFVQCMPPKARQLFKGGILYYKVSYVLKFHPRGIWLPKVVGYVGGTPVVDLNNYELNWQPVMQDQGYMQLENRVDANGRPLPHFGKVVPIERNGKPVTQQVLLDGAGLEATDKFQPPLAYAGQLVPYYLKFRQFPSKNFASLITRGFN